MSAPTRGHNPADRQLVLAAKLRARRTTLQRLAEVRGWVGGFRAPHRDVSLTSADGVRLAASWLPGPSRRAPALVLVHGFAAHRRKPAYALLADHLAATCNVLAVDLRGHGGSGGVSTLGSVDHLDVVAAVEAMRDRCDGPVVPIGVSLGAATVGHALARGLVVDGAVLVSVSARHWDSDLPALRTLHDLLHHPVKRRLWQALAGFRVHPPARIERYADPEDLVGGVSVPLLVVHGEDDGYYGPDHAEALVARAAGPAVLWREPAGFGHAEDGITPAFAGRLADAVAHLARTGTFPERP